MACTGQSDAKQATENEQKFASAIESVRSQDLTLREAAVKFGIPKSTLHDRLSDKNTYEQAGRPLALSPEIEKKLSQMCKHLAEGGFALTPLEFRRQAAAIVRALQTKNGEQKSDTENSPSIMSTDWAKGFKKRNPECAFLKPRGRVKNVQLTREEQIAAVESFFRAFDRLNLELKLTKIQVWNEDETGSTQREQPAYVAGHVTQKTIAARTSSNAKHITMAVCICADGSVAPPLFVCKGNSLDSAALDRAPKDSLIISSPSGFITEDIFVEWLQHWADYARQKTNLPLVLIVDNHTSHVGLRAAEVAEKNGVHLLALPSNTTDLLQPLDVGMFRTFKANVRQALHAHLLALKKPHLIDREFIELVGSSWTKTFTVKRIQECFRKVGLFPRDPTRIRIAREGCAENKSTSPVRTKVSNRRIPQLQAEVKILKEKLATAMMQVATLERESISSKRRANQKKVAVASIVNRAELIAAHAAAEEKKKKSKNEAKKSKKNVTDSKSEQKEAHSI